MIRHSETRRLAQRCILASLPALSDETALHIHDLLIHMLEVFEARYGEQIDRFYENLHDEAQLEGPVSEESDPPF